MADARRLATGLVSASIALLGLGLVAGGGILIASGSALIGIVLALFGLGALAGAFFFNLVPIVSDAYEPPRRGGGDGRGGDDAGNGE